MTKSTQRVLFIFMLTNSIQIYQYNGSPVTFQKGDSVMVNATEMAKAFDFPGTPTISR